MKTVVSSKGQIVLPAELRKRDRILAGDRFTIERVKAGSYLMTLEAPKGTLVEWLLACPVKGWFEPMDRSDTNEKRMAWIERALSGRESRTKRAPSVRSSGRRGVTRRSRR